MKKYVLIALFLGFSCLCFFQTTKAQGFETFRSEIPFEFSIGDETFEAGKYTIRKIKSTSEPQLFQLVDENNKPLKIFSAVSASTVSPKQKNDFSLIFKRRGEDHFLAGLNVRSNIFSFEVKQSRSKLANRKRDTQKNSPVGSPEKT